MSEFESVYACVRARVCVCVCVTMKTKSQMNGKHDKRYRQYFKKVAASTTQRNIKETRKNAQVLTPSIVEETMIHRSYR